MLKTACHLSARRVYLHLHLHADKRPETQADVAAAMPPPAAQHGYRKRQPTAQKHVQTATHCWK
jgi:hypothetical protein